MKGLNKESRLLGMGSLSISCRLYSFLGCFKVQGFVCFRRPANPFSLAGSSETVISIAASGPAALASSGASLALKLEGAVSLIAGG